MSATPPALGGGYGTLSGHGSAHAGPAGPRVDPAAVATNPAPAGRDAALRRACAELEGVFFQEMLKALRATVPEGGVVDGGTGEEIFTSLMDGHLSTLAALRSGGALGEALYRQLGGATADAPEPAPRGGELPTR